MDKIAVLIPCYNESKTIEKVVKDYVAEKECKNGLALWPLRTAVSGKQMTPGGAYEIMGILGKEESIARIKKGIEMLEAEVNEEGK